jgi:hypothetical protein
MNRFINCGSFGVRGETRIALLKTINTDTFFADYREKGTRKRITRSLETRDLDEAKKKIAEILEHKKEGRSFQRDKRETVLYVIQRGDNGPIKVGISRNLKSRIAQLQGGNAEKLKVLRVYRMMDVERAVHAELERTSRLEGEWFPAELLPLVDRFFNVALEIALKRSRARFAVEVSKVEHLQNMGLL